MSQTPNLDAARASLQQAIDQANAIVKPIIDAMREAGMLTPAPEPAAAPAVDDDLALALCEEIGASYGAEVLPSPIYMRAVLRTEPFQRLRAAWTAETVRERDDLALRLEGVEAHRERLLEDARTRDEGELAEVERLRAAQQLPDVGPVRRDHTGQLWVGGDPFHAEPGMQPEMRRDAAELIAVAAFLDAEAADTGSDDEVESLARVMHGADSAAISGWENVDQDAYRDMARAVIQVRARGGQEAARDR